MGPILRAEIGDTIQIHFWNKATHNYTMHPHVSCFILSLFPFLYLSHLGCFLSI